MRVHGVEPGVYVVHKDELAPFLSGKVDASTGGVRAKLGSGNSVTFTPRVAAETRKLLAKHTGMYRGVVRKPAIDVWSPGWEIVTDDDTLRAELVAFDQNVRVWPNLRGIKRAMRVAYERARRDGRSLLYYRLADETGDGAQPPKNVTGIHELRVIPRSQIKRIVVCTPEDAQRDPTLKPLIGQPLYYEIYERHGSHVKEKKVHWQRAILLIPEPDEEAEEPDGESELDPLLSSAEMRLNILFAGTSAYTQRASPFLVVTIKSAPETAGVPAHDEEPVPDEDIAKIREKLEKVQSGTENKIILENAEISTLHGSSDLPDPTPFKDMHNEEAAASSGIPQRELKGSEAGAIASAEWDMRRYESSVVGPIREEVGTGWLLEHYERVRQWGLVKAKGRILGITWYPLLQLDEPRKADLIWKLGLGLRNLAQLRVNDQPLPIPEEARAMLTFPEGTDLDGGLTLAPSAPFGFGNPNGAFGDAHHGHRRRARADAQAPRVGAIEDRLEAALRRAFRSWLAEAIASLPAAGQDASEAEEERIRRALVRLTFDDADLREAIAAALIEAAEQGLMATWKSMGKQGVLRFIETRGAPALRQYARIYSAEKAAAATARVREVVAQTLADGGSVREVRKSIEAAFEGIENSAAIARTEAMAGYNEGSRHAMIEAGVTHYEFVVWDAACEICEPLDGQRFPVSDTSMMPPRGTHPRCRCTIVPVLPGGAAA